MKRLLSSASLALYMATFGFASGAGASEHSASTPEFLASLGADAQAVRWQSVGDDVLARQTGKNPGAEAISGFVLDVVSKWHMPNHAAAVAQASIAVDAAAPRNDQVHVHTSAHVRGGVGDNGANTAAVATGGQNVSVNGVSQITQVAGDNNVGTNSAVIDYNGASTAPLAGTHAASASGSGSGTGIGSASASDTSGSITASVAIGNSGISLALNTPAGVATQTIAPGSAQQPGSIAQLLQVAGNGQAVTNRLVLSLQTQQMSSALLRQLGVLQALQNAAIARR
ncbi:peptidase C39 [Trinickia fusca]|uniref:Peptidase C39 n=1 Tax=Trinickia fusca TaxID=2419777 RepID=A0A494XN02_9BURK|nr:peptidase C39 [Trinickia fusca]RKP52008.1 peptidase C39 [Trinickia fusca]